MTNTMEMTAYYNFRKEVRKLYENDVNLSGDLCCKLLEIRDRYRCVNMINLSIQNYNIDLEFVEGTSRSKITEVITRICNSIRAFISDNKDHLSRECTVDPAFDVFLEASNFIFCDIVNIGDRVTITL